MFEVLYLLGQLKATDTEWIAHAGTKRALAGETVLIEEGITPKYLYIVLEGRLRIEARGVGVINTLSSGETIGEMSFVDTVPPRVNVLAHGGCVVLELSRHSLQAKVEREPDFGLRFYRALSIFLADRLRGAINRMGYEGQGSLGGDDSLEDELDDNVLDDNVLDNVGQAGGRFNRMLTTLASARLRES